MLTLLFSSLQSSLLVQSPPVHITSKLNDNQFVTSPFLADFLMDSLNGSHLDSSHLISVSLSFNRNWSILLFSCLYYAFPPNLHSNFKSTKLPLSTLRQTNPIRSPSRDQPPGIDQSNSTNPTTSWAHFPYLANMTPFSIYTCQTSWHDHVDSFTYPNQHLNTLHQSWSHQIRSLSYD